MSHAVRHRASRALLPYVANGSTYREYHLPRTVHSTITHALRPTTGGNKTMGHCRSTPQTL